MKLAVSSLLLSSLIIDCRAYLTSSPRQRVVTFVRSSKDAAFSAFAETLDEEPVKIAEKSWQAKLEDLLDP